MQRLSLIKSAPVVDPSQVNRDAENENVLDRWRRGETLAMVPPSATWFPPRPIIKKDQREMARLYGNPQES